MPPTLSDLERQIGLTPRPQSEYDILERLGGDSRQRTELRLLLTAWVALKGIPKASAYSALDTSLAKAYCKPNYLAGWRSKVNPSWDLLEGDEDDEAPKAPAATPTTTPAQNLTREETAQWLRDAFAPLLTQMEKAVDDKLARTTLKIDPAVGEQIKTLARIAAQQRVAELMPPRMIEIRDSTHGTIVPLGFQHERFPILLRSVQARDPKGFGLNIWLTGPTGSGKTSAAEAVSHALAGGFSRYANADGRWTITDEDGSDADLNGLAHDAPFGADSSLDADYKVIGFKDANGKFHWTTFLRVFVYGGVYVADEIDNWAPSALLALNAALANGWISTPIGMLRRHKDCIIIACANTWGLGATSEYVGRTRLDAASLDRFQPKINWPIDETLERAIAKQQGETLGTEWHDTVLAARRKAATQGLKVIISPRATFNGISLLLAGFERQEVIDMTLGAGLSAEQKKAIGLDAAPATANAIATAHFSNDHLRYLLNNGRKIEAIRLYREAHGCDLHVAKQAVEALERVA